MTRDGHGRDALPIHSLPLDATAPRTVETATFGLGCFWGPDARFGVLPGVVRTRVGYAGGSTPSPTYRDLGDHTEVVQVDFDPDVLSYRDLLDQFWRSHDARARSPVRQYQNLVLWHDERQRTAVEESRAARETRRGHVSTRTEPLSSPGFTLAEDYHQKYHLRGSGEVFDAVCAVYDEPDAVRESTVAARLNGFVAGYGTPGLFDAEADSYGLPADVLETVRARVD
ncbi:peptide-methionine (S)-S-oxide reductase MsrA [Haloarchaeobius sp. TZWWS8]|uniref:peptide-methionine (S)-S-oxide reductase MsrA n=1 Tax=Haloarchaeobius sp. TZWWS8 TaxID=3446121 RepID=UPI003EB90E92